LISLFFLQELSSRIQ
jgi:hypothetical protein